MRTGPKDANPPKEKVIKTKHYIKSMSSFRYISDITGYTDLFNQGKGHLFHELSFKNERTFRLIKS